MSFLLAGSLRTRERGGKRKEIADTRGALGCSAEAASGGRSGGLWLPANVFPFRRPPPLPPQPSQPPRPGTPLSWKRHLRQAPPPKVGGGPDALRILLGGLLWRPGLGRPLSCFRVGRRPSPLQMEEKRAQDEEDSVAGVGVPGGMTPYSAPALSHWKGDVDHPHRVCPRFRQHALGPFHPDFEPVCGSLLSRVPFCSRIRLPDVQSSA